MSRLAHALALLGLSAVSIAQEPPSLIPVAERYARVQTYCETGKWGMRWEPQHAFQDTAFRGCAHRDGRMKYVEYTDRDRQVYTWADAAGLYRHSEFGNFYKAYTDGNFPTHWGFRREPLPALTSRLFTWNLDHLAGHDALRGLAAFKPKAALSTPERAVFERFHDANERRGERLYLSNRDQTLVRFEELKDGVVMRYVEVAAQLDRPLADADLSHQAPLWTRYSLANNQPVFLGALFALTTLLSGGFWALLLATAQDRQRILQARRKLWLYQLLALGATIVVLLVLTAVSIVVPGSGHPPAIVAVFVLAFWAALIFGLVACFTLASYPVQWLLRGDTMAR